METRVTRLVVLPQFSKIYGERATQVEIDDEAGGEFVVVRQCPDKGEQEVRIDPEEWPTLREAIERMIGECRS